MKVPRHLGWSVLSLCVGFGLVHFGCEPFSQPLRERDPAQGAGATSAAKPLPPAPNPAERLAQTPPEEATAANPHESPYRLDQEEQTLLNQWFKGVGRKNPGERFGQLVARAAKFQLGTPYVHKPRKVEVEHLSVTLASFQCVSFVESTLALARCIWMNQPQASCFLREVEQSRYRGGRVNGYGSRLHYFSDWMLDNHARGRIRILRGKLGVDQVRQAFHYMTDHKHRYPSLSNPERQQHIAQAEARLTQSFHPIIPRDRVAVAQQHLEDGDLIGLVGSKPGLLITHAGFVHRGTDGVPRLLHASSYHKRVLLTRSALSAYVLRSSSRRGIMVGRPRPPGSPNRTTIAAD